MNTSFLKHFNTISDPRSDRKTYPLLDLLFLSISAVISGAEGWEQIEDFGHAKLDWLKQYLPFQEGIPTHDTIARVISHLKADEIEASFQSWISTLIKTTGCDVIAIDGKTARRSFSTKHRRDTLHAVSAWSVQNQLVLGQVATDQKSNEITAIPELLNLLNIEKSIITLDAMGCQKKIAAQIIQKKADYILALKGNHSGMQAELEAWWHKVEREGLTDENFDEYTKTNSGHGRIETRTCQQMKVNKTWLTKKYQWAAFISIIKIHTEVYEKTTRKTTMEVRWYISSLNINAKEALHAIRSHWQVESMHWILDMTFREDESRIRRGNGALAFNVMRKIALNLFKQDKTRTASIIRKKKMASLDDNYRTTLLEEGV